MIVALLAIVLTLILVVGLHEAGHALAAKITGVRIQRISIGFGKPVLTWRGKQGCEWVWAMLPFGGYVQLLNTRVKEVDKKEYPYTFDKQPAWVKCFILVSGALANLVVAVIALTVYFMVGYQQVSPIVASVTPDSIAAAAGLKAQDRFIEVDGVETNSWQDVGMLLMTNMGKNNIAAKIITTENVEKDVTLDLHAVPAVPNKSLLAVLGIDVGVMKTPETVAGQSFMVAGKHAIQKSWQLLCFFLSMLKQIILGVISFSMLLGPIGLLAVSVGSLTQGFSVYLYFIASLSLAVGLVNLFPVPTLDGGSIVYALVEKVRGKPVSIPLEILIHRLTMIVLVMLFVHLIMNDVHHFIR